MKAVSLIKGSTEEEVELLQPRSLPALVAPEKWLITNYFYNAVFYIYSKAIHTILPQIPLIHQCHLAVNSP